MKKYSPFESPALWKDSFALAFIILGGIATVMSALSVTLECVGKIPARTGLVVVVYVVITGVILFVKYRRPKSKIMIDIRGIKVTVKQGYIFRADG
jgi:formate-dependent nitrite reductase membrane component NrfD